ncbi:MAG: ATP phosphoribosyltransferase regulatory subunit, partial [Hydrogenophaga sp.]|nr:ATP phosphoribosyltransferase regulatory subunit [Hydrogenophaga sp.]
PRLFGDVGVLDEARQTLQPSAELHAALNNLQWLAEHARGLDVSIDLADLRGYAYYTGMRFALFSACQQGRTGQSIELARGGRYDEVGAVFGRKRPAVGFSLDLKELVSTVSPRALEAAIRAPWGMDTSLREAVAALRLQGHTVVCVLPGHEHEVDEFHCDRELLQEPACANAWTVRNIQMETRN